MPTTPYKRGLLTAMALGAIMIGGASTAGADPACTMPNLVGMDLQGAKDAIQSLTHGAVFFSSSTDLTGKVARRLDRNWTVCSSTPAPGATFSATTRIDFGVVRDGERCPS
jgi:hypothetical protein